MKKLFILFSLLLYSAWSAELYLQKGEIVIEENFDADKINVTIWQSAKRQAGQKAENGYYHYDCSQSQDKLKRISLGHVLSDPVGDLVLEFKIMPTEGFKGFNIGFNDEQGHCLVNNFATDKIYSYKYKEKNKHSFHEYLDIAGSSLKEGNEYTVTLEICGSKVFLHIDDKHFLICEHERFKNPKTRVFFGFHGGKGKVDSIKLWHGKPIDKPDSSPWTLKKKDRHPVNLNRDKNFKKKKLLSDARHKLKDDAQYQAKLKAIQDKWHEIRAKHKYFQNYGIRKKEKEARKTNVDYQKALKEFEALEKAELDYIYKQFPELK